MRTGLLGLTLPLALVLVGCTPGCGSGGGDDTTTVDASTSTPDGSVVTTDGAAPGADAAPAPVRDVHLYGRFELTTPTAPRCSFPGCTIVARFTGTAISARLRESGTSQWTVRIDAAAPTVIKTSSATETYALASGLAAGEHRVELMKRTESYVGISSFLGFTITGGALVQSPAPWTRRIELIGDSITCGYGALGAVPTCPFSADTEDETQAYGAVTARRLDAAHTAVCYSGKGVYRNYGGNTSDPMPVIYGRMHGDLPTPAWDFAREIPDVVVINLGTNDFSGGDPGRPYVDAMKALVATVRGHYPQAHIVLAVGSMLGTTEAARVKTYLQEVVTARATGGDSKVSFVEFAEQQMADTIGCDYHPSVRTHAKMADVLTAHIKSLTGW